MRACYLSVLALLATPGLALSINNRQTTMAIQITSAGGRVERAMGEGLRRLYRLPQLTPAPAKKAGVGSYA